jgi:hypothetical protein
MEATESRAMKMLHVNETFARNDDQLSTPQTEAVSVVPSPDANITVFAPTDNAFLSLFQASGTAACKVDQNKCVGPSACCS